MGQTNPEVCLLEFLEALAFLNNLCGLYPRPLARLTLPSPHPPSVHLAVLPHHRGLLNFGHLHRALPRSHHPLQLALHRLALASGLIPSTYNATAVMRVKPPIIRVEGAEASI
jgi:hypothetical protein